MIPDPETQLRLAMHCGHQFPCFPVNPGHASDCWRPGSWATSSESWILFPPGEFGINYLDDDFMLSLANESSQKGEGTLHWKPETRVLPSRATYPEDVTEENPGTIQAADEVEEEAPHHLLRHKEGREPGLPLPHQFSLAKWHLLRAFTAKRDCLSFCRLQ